jgi:hypothetical protein
MSKGVLVKAGTSALHFLNQNNTKIMSGIAILGVVSTAASSIEAYKTSCEILEDEDEDLPIIDIIKKCWWAWIKPVSIGSITIACIAGAEIKNTNKQLEMAAAYGLLKNSSDRFRDYALQEIGERKVRAIEHKINEDDIRKVLDERGLSEKEIASCDAENGGALFKDSYTGQIFPSTYEKIYRAVDRVNDKLANVKTQDENGMYNGGCDKVSVADFIVDCGGDYSEAAEKYVFLPLSFGKPIPSKSDICDPHVMEYKGHMCTIVQLNYIADEWDFFCMSGNTSTKRSH